MGKHAEQTRNAILDAFLAAIKEKQVIEKVYVRDVANIGHFSRSTFYAYFDGIDDLTNALATKYGEEVSEVVRAGIEEEHRGGSVQAPYLRMLEYLTSPDVLPLTKILLLDASNKGVTEAIAAPLEELVYEEYRKRHPEVSESVHRRSAVFWVYGMYGLLKDWVKNGCDRDIEHIAEDMALSIQLGGNWNGKD